MEATKVAYLLFAPETVPDGGRSVDPESLLGKGHESRGARDEGQRGGDTDAARRTLGEPVDTRARGDATTRGGSAVGTGSPSTGGGTSSGGTAGATRATDRRNGGAESAVLTLAGLVDHNGDGVAVGRAGAGGAEGSVDLARGDLAEASLAANEGRVVPEENAVDDSEGGRDRAGRHDLQLDEWNVRFSGDELAAADETSLCQVERRGVAAGGGVDGSGSADEATERLATVHLGEVALLVGDVDEAGDDAE